MIYFTLEQLKDIRRLYSFFATDVYKIRATLPILSSVLKIYHDIESGTVKDTWVYHPLKLGIDGTYGNGTYGISIYSYDTLLAKMVAGYIVYYFCDSDEFIESIGIDEFIKEMYYIQNNFFPLKVHLRNYNIDFI